MLINFDSNSKLQCYSDTKQEIIISILCHVIDHLGRFVSLATQQAPFSPDDPEKTFTAVTVVIVLFLKVILGDLSIEPNWSWPKVPFYELRTMPPGLIMGRGKTTTNQSYWTSLRR